MTFKRLTELVGIVTLLEPADYQAGIDSESIKVDLYRHLTALLNFGAVTGDAVLKVYSGVTAAKTTAIAFKTRLAGADFKATGNDQFGAESTSVAADGVTLTAATYDHRELAVEVDLNGLTDGHKYITFELSAAADALTLAATAILSDPRFLANVMPTAVD